MRYLTSVVIAMSVTIVIAGAQTVSRHRRRTCGGREGRRRIDYAGIATRLCTPPAPPAPRTAHAGRAAPGRARPRATPGTRSR